MELLEPGELLRPLGGSSGQLLQLLLALGHLAGCPLALLLEVLDLPRVGLLLLDFLNTLAVRSDEDLRLVCLLPIF